MKTLVIGASGATGKLLVEQLVNSGKMVKVVVRPSSNLPECLCSNDKISVIKTNITDISVDEMSDYLADCQAVASCIGHKLTWKGIFGKPRKLVTTSVQLVCEAILKTRPTNKIKVVLMNTAGNSNRDIDEPVSLGQKIVIGLLRLMLPPHPDNEKAADYLRVQVGQKNSYIEWVVVRPDTLTNEEKVTEYTLHTSPTRSAIFNPGRTSRINVGNFMSRLILDEEVWNTWKGQMPVIYNERVNGQ